MMNVEFTSKIGFRHINCERMNKLKSNVYLIDEGVYWCHFT